jgi:deoxycytidylate deaminase
MHKCRVGAVIVSGGRVVAVGHNELRGFRCPTKKRWENSLHAEQKAILRLLTKGRLHHLVGATIYVSRIKADGTYGMAKPCSYCYQLIQAVGIKEIVYTTEMGTNSLKL